ncbi:unnamed protein product [Blepharisma stoltei]|uniref:EamA domain-containing protein n=1 Tax=Blepharisma stoltei TaxID=1481888 RepID=A0AAU9INT3_9CILI|nr:unnamed protein product [Blepharisma stoltei]
MAEDKTFIYAFMGSYMLFGAGVTVIIKSMDVLDFSHPYFQVTTLFIGEFSCLFVYLLHKQYIKSRSKLGKYKVLSSGKPSIPQEGIFKKYGANLFGIPAFLYLISGSLMYLGLILSAASVYQMIRGLIPIVVAFYSVIFLRRKLFKHQMIGIGLILVGVIIVGISSLLFQAWTARHPLIGVIVLVISQLFTGGVLICEEFLMWKLDINPMQATGVEGMWGFGYSLIFLPIIYFIPCDHSSACSRGRVEDSIYAFQQIGDSLSILLLWLGSIFSIAIVYWTGIATTKYTSALARSTIDTCRTIFVWVFSILIGWEDFVWMQLVGFLLIIGGTIVFNEIIIIPFFGLKESVQKRREGVLVQSKEEEDRSPNNNVGDMGV